MAESALLLESVRAADGLSQLALPLLAVSDLRVQLAGMEMLGLLLHQHAASSRQLEQLGGLQMVGLYIERHGDPMQQMSSCWLDLALGELRPTTIPAEQDGHLTHPAAVTVLIRTIRDSQQEQAVVFVLQRVAAMVTQNREAACQLLDHGVMHPLWLLIRKQKSSTVAANGRLLLTALLHHALHKPHGESWIKHCHQMPQEWQQLALRGLAQLLVEQPLLARASCANVVNNLVFMLQWAEQLAGWKPPLCKLLIQLINKLAGENPSDTVELMKHAGLLRRRDQIIMYVLRGVAHGVLQSREWCDTVCEFLELISGCGAEWESDGLACVFKLFDDAPEGPLQLLYGMLLKGVVGSLQANRAAAAELVGNDEQVAAAAHVQTVTSVGSDLDVLVAGKFCGAPGDCCCCYCCYCNSCSLVAAGVADICRSRRVR